MFANAYTRRSFSIAICANVDAHSIAIRSLFHLYFVPFLHAAHHSPLLGLHSAKAPQIGHRTSMLPIVFMTAPFLTTIVASPDCQTNMLVESIDYVEGYKNIWNDRNKRTNDNPPEKSRLYHQRETPNVAKRHDQSRCILHSPLLYSFVPNMLIRLRHTVAHDTLPFALRLMKCAKRIAHVMAKISCPKRNDIGGKGISPVCAEIFADQLPDARR